MVKVKATRPQQNIVNSKLAKGHGKVPRRGGKEPMKPEPRKRNGDAALNEIRKQQRSVDLLLKRAPMERLVKSITRGFRPDFRWQGDAIVAVMEASQSFIITSCQKWNRYAIHRKCITISPKDVQLDKDIMMIAGRAMFPVPPVYDSLGVNINND